MGADIDVDIHGGIRLVARRIAIIGAGPAGLAAARMFLEENQHARQGGSEVPFTTVAVFERNSSVGGVWCHTADVAFRYNVPQPGAAQAAVRGCDAERAGGLPTAMYDDLRTNLPKDIMQFAGFAFPAGVPDFPSRADVLQYLRDYAAAHVLGPELALHLSTEVVDVAYSAGAAQWTCTVRSLDAAAAAGATRALPFDAVLVCAGRCRFPRIPDVPGLAALAARHPRRVIHAREYRRAADFAARSVLVVGSSSSASDISRQLSYTAAAVHVSTRPLDDLTAAFVPRFGCGCGPAAPPQIHPVVARFGPDRVLFADGSSIALPDAVIYATGYIPIFPFVAAVQPLLPGLEPRPFCTDAGPSDMYRHLVYAPNPLLAVFDVPTKTSPFPLFEYQAMYLAQVYQGNIRLPSTQHMLDAWQDALKTRSDPYFLGMDQIQYRNDIVDAVAAAAAEGRTHAPRLGHTPAHWSDLAEYTLSRRIKCLGY
ncbi:monooxygenase [Coemansia javaensis]|uniref:Monooxygenase n=1 Tax=Coemansia javaensis TaxID=2761396 RepID=A0A9W8LFM5_9FUNG|nr:monooxygenase [Coemansia javaensis]